MNEIDPDRDSLDIHGLSSGGDGVGKGSDGRTLFVPLTAPGDRVGVRIVRRRKRYGHAVLEAIEQAAPERVTPACPLFGKCGGCDWQHLAYEQQTHWKGQIVQQTMQRVGKIEIDVPTVYAAPEAYRTRSRARLPLSEDKRPGFFRSGSREVVEVEHCPVLTDENNELLAALFELLPSFPLYIASVRILSAGAGLALSLHMLADKPLPKVRKDKALTAWCEELAQRIAQSTPADEADEAAKTFLSGVSWWRGRKLLGRWGELHLWEGAPAIAYRPESFAQASFACNETLRERVVALLDPDANSELVELYAGRGNFSLPLAEKGARVLALDSDAQALSDGRLASDRAGLKQRISFRVLHDQAAPGSLVALCREHGHDNPQKLLLDPPRQGLSPEICAQIITLNPQFILYVSCDPATLARDLKKLVAAGYELRTFEVVDLIPQTAHVESLALLYKAD